MIDDAFYWIFAAIVVAVVVAKSGKPKAPSSVRNYLLGAGLGALAAFVVGFLAEHTNPLDTLLLRRTADIYSVFLISISYGMVIRALLWVASRAKPPQASPTKEAS